MLCCVCVQTFCLVETIRYVTHICACCLTLTLCYAMLLTCVHVQAFFPRLYWSLLATSYSSGATTQQGSMSGAAQVPFDYTARERKVEALMEGVSGRDRFGERLFLESSSQLCNTHCTQYHCHNPALSRTMVCRLSLQRTHLSPRKL